MMTDNVQRTLAVGRQIAAQRRKSSPQPTPKNN